MMKNFEEIVRETHMPIRALIHGCGVPVDDVDDLAQQVYIEFSNHREKVPEGVTELQWLRGIAKNMCMNHYRKQKRSRANMQLAIAEILIQTETSWETNEGNEMGDRLKHCLEKLPERSRQMIALRYEQELISEEISAKFDMSAASLRKTLHRILTALRECLSRTPLTEVSHA